MHVHEHVQDLMHAHTYVPEHVHEHVHGLEHHNKHGHGHGHIVRDNLWYTEQPYSSTVDTDRIGY